MFSHELDHGDGVFRLCGSNLVQTLRRNALNVRAISREERPDTEAVSSYGPDTDWSQHLRAWTVSFTWLQECM